MRRLTSWMFVCLVLGFLSFPIMSGAVVEGIQCTPEPTDMFIMYGNLVTCSIDVAGDSDVYRFSGGVGEVVVIQGTWQSGSMRPCIELVSPDNTRLKACANSFSNRIDTTLNQAGTYTILFTDAFSTGTGGYALALERLIPPSPTVGLIQYGETINDEVNPVGDMDLFFFQGTVGDTIALQGTWQSGSMRPCIELVSPDNTRLKACANSFSNRIDTTLNQAGTYTILFTDAFSTGTGGYALALQCLSGACVVAPTFTIFPASGKLVTTSEFDLTLIVETPGLSVVGGSARFNGSDVTIALRTCVIPGTLISGGQTFRCPDLTGGFLGIGTHTLSVTLDLSDGSSVGGTASWEVKENTEP